ncbi:OsmC family protein [Candidatus Hydrogenedentota bacterium]
MPIRVAVEAELLDKMQVSVRYRSHEDIIDEPVEMGGEDEGPTPVETLVGSVASCTAITLRMGAEKHGIPLKSVSMKLSGEFVNPKRFDGRNFLIRNTVDVKGHLTDEHLDKLEYFVTRCPVHMILEGGVAVETEIRLRES